MITILHGMEDTLGHWVIARRWWIIAATLTIVVLTLENTYTESRNVLFIITPKNQDVFTQNTLSALEDLTATAWKIPYSNRVDSISNFQYTYADNSVINTPISIY